MKLNIRRLIPALFAVFILVGLTACSTPRRVNHITGNTDQVKFIYSERSLFSVNTGVVRCTTDKYGFVQSCTDMEIRFEE